MHRVRHIYGPNADRAASSAINQIKPSWAREFPKIFHPTSSSFVHTYFQYTRGTIRTDVRIVYAVEKIHSSYPLLIVQSFCSFQHNTEDVVSCKISNIRRFVFFTPQYNLNRCIRLSSPHNTSKIHSQKKKKPRQEYRKKHPLLLSTRKL